MKTLHARWLVLVVCVLVGGATGARAQTCGDPDASGTVDIIDAANVLRAAVGLPSACTAVPAACDVSGGNGIDVIDAANVLRAAVQLPATLACAEITQFIESVEDTGGTPATLDLGIAPIPGAGAPATITAVDGKTQVAEGGINTVTITLDANGAGAAAAASDPGLIIAVQRDDGTFAGGFFDLPLDMTAGEVTIVVMFSQALGKDRFALEFATRVQGVVGQYIKLPQIPVSGITPTPRRTPTPRKPTPTPTPFCGNGKLDPGEECDPPANPFNCFCLANCKCEIIG